MARGIPLVIIDGSWTNPCEGERASLLGFQGAEARLLPIQVRTLREGAYFLQDKPSNHFYSC